MITTETVLILGAGASVPYGYPTGAELRRYICKIFPASYLKLLNKLRDHSHLSENHEHERAKHFAEVFFESSTPSIDLFLARNPQFSDIGKIAIVLSIWEAELDSRFREDIEKPEEGDWYSYLYQRMTDELIDPDSYKRFAQNKLTFITFNYDRSLEHFLYQSFTNSFMNSLKSRRATVNNFRELIPFPIVHVYGVISDLPWQSGKGLEYGRDPNFGQVKEMKENIKVIYDRNDADLPEATRKIERANRVFFLGFGYAKENLDILGMPGVLNQDQEIYGTALGMKEKEITAKRTYLRQNLAVKNLPLTNPDLKPMNCLELLREYL